MLLAPSELDALMSPSLLRGAMDLFLSLSLSLSLSLAASSPFEQALPANSCKSIVNRVCPMTSTQKFRNEEDTRNIRDPQDIRG